MAFEHDVLTQRYNFFNFALVDATEPELAYIEGLDEAIDENNSELINKKIAFINEGISILPPKCKETFLLSKKEGLTNIEIAEYLNLSIKTVEGHLTKAYHLLKKNVGTKLNKILFLLFGFDKTSKFIS